MTPPHAANPLKPAARSTPIEGPQRPFGFMKHSVLVLLLTLSGCMARPTVTSWLDPISVATLTSQVDPLVLARVTASRRIDQKEFAQLTALEINRMGTRRLYLVLSPRSTRDLTPKQQASFERSFGQIELRLDDRPMLLTQYQGAIKEIGIGQAALPLPIPGSTHIYFPIARAELQAMAASSQVKLSALGLPMEPQLYEEWKDGRGSLSDFLDQLPGGPTEVRQGEAP